MTSTVTNYSQYIDPNFPIAGVDNDTKGFRDNFGYIRNALKTAADEISSLQVNYVNLYKSVAPVTSKGTNGDKAGMFYANSSTIYVCYADYTTGSDDIWAKVSTSAGTW